MPDFSLISKLAVLQERPFADLLQQELERQLRQFAHAAAHGKSDADAKAVTRRMAPEWERGLVEAKGNWPLAFAVHGYKTAGLLMGQKAFVAEFRAKEDTSFGVEVDVDLFGADELVANHLKPEVGKWIAATSKYETATSAARYEKLFHDAFGTQDGNDSLTPLQLAARIVQDGLTQSRERAIMMSRTITNWAYNEGAEANYAAYGVEAKEWLTTVDDAACPLCRPLNGKQVAIGTAYLEEGATFVGESGAKMKAEFTIKHPPLHPRCRCTLLPVLLDVDQEPKPPAPKPDPTPDPDPVPKKPRSPRRKNPDPQDPAPTMLNPQPAEPPVDPTKLTYAQAVEHADKQVKALMEKVETEAAEFEAPIKEKLEQKKARISDLMQQRSTAPDSNRRNAITREIHALLAEVEQSERRLASLLEVKRQIFMKHLVETGEENAQRFKIRIQGAGVMQGKDEQEFKRKLDAANNFWGQVTSGNPHVQPAGKVAASPHTDYAGGRAYYLPDDKGGKVVLAKKNKTDVFIHELGHAYETHNPHVKRRANDFLSSRTVGEQPQRLRDVTGNHRYGVSEVTKKDNFHNPYVGKIYSDGSTEVISMGAEEMYRDPLGFARRDPDYFRFMVGVMKGWI